MQVEDYIAGVKRAASFLQTSNFEKAIEHAVRLIEARPERIGAYLVTAQAYLKQRNFQEAEEILKSGYEKTGDDQLNLNLAVVQSKAGKHLEAAALFGKIGLNKIDSDVALFQYAKSLVENGDEVRGVEVYKKCLEANPKNRGALNNIANLYQHRQQFEDARKYYETLINHYPQEAMAFSNLGGLYEKFDQVEMARNAFAKAIELNPELGIAYYNLGHLLANRLNQYEEALAVFDNGLKNAKGDFWGGIRFQQILARQHLIDWSNYEGDTKDLVELVEEYVATEVPVFDIVPYNLSYSKLPNDLYLKMAEKYAERLLEKVKKIYPNTSYDHTLSQGKIKVGYYSPNFVIHPGGTLVRTLFNFHDSSDFEIHAFSLVHADDFVNRDIRESVDYYHDVSQLTAVEIADLVNRTGIDILVGLAGYNASMKMEVMALRPAPIQMVLIGSHETTGASFIDYVFSDEYLMDHEVRTNFSEHVITLPCSLLLNSEFHLAETKPTTRSDHGLPEDKVVLAAFNHPKKLDPETFNSWMQVLKELPNAVIWMYDGGKRHVRRSMIDYAKEQGVSEERFVFADPMDIRSHWERFRHADLFLDNFIYNAHVTAIEALRFGKPIITRKGDNHNSLLCASLLHHAGLDTLITATTEEYINEAVLLANNASKRKEIEEHLQKESLPLFDSKMQVMYLEKAFKQAFYLQKKNGQSKDFIVGSLLKFDSFN